MQTGVKRLKGERSYNGERALVYDVSYPYIIGVPAGEIISASCKKDAVLAIKRGGAHVLRLAARQKKEMGKAFHEFSVTSETQIMFVGKSVFSFFTDIYYDLGFWGKKCVRRSQTRNCENGKSMSVKDLFRGGADHTGLIINAVLGQMSAFEEETGMPLYKGWREEIEKSVFKDRFYLADDGIALYVPQGSITADIWGVPTFLINYKELNGSIKRILL